MNDQNDAELLEHLKTIPGLDFSTGLANLSGNVVQYHKLLVQFDGMFRDDIKQMVETLDQRGVKEVRSLIHSLKGAAGTLGLANLHNCAVALDTHLRDRDDVVGQQAVELTRILDVEMDRFHHFLVHRGAGL